MAVGAAAKPNSYAAWVIDWEGPCDREIITAGGTIMAPANGHKLTDDDYWHPREAVRQVPKRLVRTFAFKPNGIMLSPANFVMPNE